MSSDHPMDRRRLLKSMAAGGALVKWPALAAATPSAEAATHPYSVFSPSQAAVMEALVEQFIPADDFPGARDAGVVLYIDQKLTGPFARFLVGHYETGFKQLDAASRERFGHDFVTLDGSQQSALLHAIDENNDAAGAHDFLQTVLSDTFEGYYGSPEDGGNRNGASWKMIGFKG